MSHRPIDLDRLPPELRRVVEQQLAKLPPAAREKLLREGSPLIEKMLAKMQGGAGGPPPLPGARQAQAAAQRASHNVSTAAERVATVAHKIERIVPHGHYNGTIRPGDGVGGGRWAIVVLLVAVGAWMFWQ